MLRTRSHNLYMTSKPRTIDNLGIDASIRYAKDKELFESRFIDESQIVSKRLEIPVAKPYVPSEFDRLFSLEKTISWASFPSLPESLVFTKSLFTYQLIPSLGTYEQHEEEDQFEALDDALNKQKEAHPDQSDKENQEEEREKKLIVELLKCIAKIDKSLSLINARRNQYQRG